MPEKIEFALHHYDSAVVEFVREVKRGAEQLDPIMSQIERLPVSHGGTTRQVSEPTILDTEMKESSVEVTMHLDWFRDTDVEAVAGFLWDFSERFVALEKVYLFETLDKTTEAVGAVVNGKDMNIWDAQIEALKTVQMSFDEEGKHGTMVAVPERLWKQLEKQPPTPEQVQRWNEVMQAKKDEYYAKKRTRRLS